MGYAPLLVDFDAFRSTDDNWYFFFSLDFGDDPLWLRDCAIAVPMDAAGNLLCYFTVTDAQGLTE